MYVFSADFSPEDADEPAHAVGRGNNMAAVSSINLCADVSFLDFSVLFMKHSDAVKRC